MPGVDGKVKRPLEQLTHLEKLQDVEAHIKVGESRVENLEVNVLHVFSDQARDFRRRVPDDVKKGDYVRTTGKVLEDFYFALDFLLLDRLEDLDDALLVADNVHALEHL